MKKGYSYYLTVKVIELYISVIGWRRVRGRITEWRDKVIEYRNPTAWMKFNQDYITPAAEWIAGKLPYTQSYTQSWNPTASIHSGEWLPATNPYTSPYSPML